MKINSKILLSALIGIGLLFSSFQSVSVVANDYSSEPYQGMFMQNDIYITMPLYTSWNPENPDSIGIAYKISKPYRGDYGTIVYDHSEEIGEIYKNGDNYYININGTKADLKYNDGSVTISNSKFAGTYVQISNAGADMDPSDVWLEFPKQSTSDVSIKLNGKNLTFDQSPYIENGTTMVPMRVTFESLGATVDYDATTKSISAHKGNIDIELVTDSVLAKVNGTTSTLPIAVTNKNGSTMIPLRFVSESLGAQVNWDNNTKTVTIIS